MTEIEQRELCARAVGCELTADGRLRRGLHGAVGSEFYDPANNRMQAMALAEHLMLAIDFFAQHVSSPPSHNADVRVYFDEDDQTVERAIVQCVAQMKGVG